MIIITIKAITSHGSIECVYPCMPMPSMRIVDPPRKAFRPASERFTSSRSSKAVSFFRSMRKQKFADAWVKGKPVDSISGGIHKHGA